MNITLKRVLPIIVLSQFLCTSLWFGGNAILADLTKELSLPSTVLGSITSSVQLGFITGTFVFALLTIADRFSPSLVFFLSAIAAAVCNVAIIQAHQLDQIVMLRFGTGFFLAGIYPVGMKIAADYFDKGLGKALGYLVGALVIGTAFPHLLKSLSLNLSWKLVLTTISVMAFVGGLMMWLLVAPGPYRRPMQKLDLAVAIKVFQPKEFRSAAFGYFGHMWELYTFWAFVPVIINTYIKINSEAVNVSFVVFIIIAIGTIGCIIAGYVSQKLGSRRTAFLALLASGCCCLASPFIFHLPLIAFIAILLFWGWTVVADSPMFSTLVAQNAGSEHKGTALTIVTCIGFLITVLSIQLLNRLATTIPSTQLYLLLVPGALLGLLSMRKLRRK